jgi:hypothetical protein
MALSSQLSISMLDLQRIFDLRNTDDLQNFFSVHLPGTKVTKEYRLNGIRDDLRYVQTVRNSIAQNIESSGISFARFCAVEN